MYRYYRLNKQSSQNNPVRLSPVLASEDLQTLYIPQELFQKLYTADDNTLDLFITQLHALGIDAYRVQFVNIGPVGNYYLSQVYEDTHTPNISIKKTINLGGHK